MMCDYIAGPYAIHHHTKPCGSVTKLATISECSDAKATLDPSDAAVLPDNEADAPSGCSRYKGKWYFNAHARGALDGLSEPVCKATSGKTTYLCLQDFEI